MYKVVGEPNTIINNDTILDSGIKFHTGSRVIIYVILLWDINNHMISFSLYFLYIIFKKYRVSFLCFTPITHINYPNVSFRYLSQY